MASIRGTKRNDKLQGTDGNDFISGLEGRDKIVAQGGYDSVSGGSGNDRITLTGRVHATVNAGDGNDVVRIFASTFGSDISMGDGADRVLIQKCAQRNQSFTIDAGFGQDKIAFAGNPGEYTISKDKNDVVTVVDANGNTYTIKYAETFTFNGIEIAPAVVIENRAPVVVNEIADKAIAEDAAFSFTIPPKTFKDADGDTLTFTVTDEDGNPLPAWLVFDPDTRTFGGTPTNDDVGTIRVVVTASDGKESVSDTFKITVENVNDDPSGTATATLAAGTEDKSYIVSAASLLAGFTDVDGDTLSIEDLQASNGATIVDNGNGTWTITPAAEFSGDVSLTYSVTDGQGGSTSGSRSVTFAAVNDAPVVSNAIADKVATEGSEFSFTFGASTFSDVDSETLTYQATLADGSDLPDWLQFDANTRTFFGTPGDADVGNIQVRLTASDGSLTVSDTFAIKINDVTASPSIVNGVLQLNEDYDYKLSEATQSGLYIVKVDGHTYTFDMADIDSINTVGSKSVAMDSRGLTAVDITGDVNFTNVTFVQANVAANNKFEASFDLKNFNVTGDILVNGSIQDYFRTAWDYLDDNYTYYDEKINSFGIDIGIKYAQYLMEGGEPLFDDIVKYTPDNGDAGTVPQRMQMLHDNLLGNLYEAAIADKFSEGTSGDISDLYTPAEIYQRIQNAGLGDFLGVIGDFNDGRQIFTGDESAINSTMHNIVRAFDYAHGWVRPDYVTFDSNGRVDAGAINGNQMYFGTGNSPDNYVIERHEGAGVETALKVHFRTGSDILPTSVDSEGVVTYVVPEGHQVNGVGNASGTNVNRSAWNFDYSALAGLNGTGKTLDDFDFVLKIDTDSSAAVDYMVFKLQGSNGNTPFVSVDVDANGNPIGGFGDEDGAGATRAQNSGNFGFGFIKDHIDDGAGYSFGEGEFDIELVALKNGTSEVLSDVHIKVVVDSDLFAF